MIQVSGGLVVEKEYMLIMLFVFHSITMGNRFLLNCLIVVAVVSTVCFVLINSWIAC